MNLLMVEKLLSTRFVTILVPWTLLIAYVIGATAASIARITPADTLRHELSRPARYENYLPILSDFDGDGRLDQAELHIAGAHHCIRVRFGSFRETQLDFGMRSLSGGALLVRDVNSDNNPDVIWVYRSKSEPSLVWLNDGAGHFTKSNEDVDIDSASLFGDTDYTVTAGFDDERICLAPARLPFDFAPVGHLEHDSCETGQLTDRDSRHYAGLDASSLRERGPPEHI